MNLSTHEESLMKHTCVYYRDSFFFTDYRDRDDNNETHMCIL
jgi:hypothetical protein